MSLVKNTNRLLKLSILAILLFSAESNAGICKKDGNQKDCLNQQNLIWLFPDQPEVSIANLRKGPGFTPELTSLELESETLFCQYFYHKFTSPGSAKFLCAKTNSQGQLLNKDGEVVESAKFVSTREMNLSVVINDEIVAVDEGVLLDANKNPLLATKITKNGNSKQELIHADEIKVKYFVDSNQYSDKSVNRTKHSFSIQNGASVERDNVFSSPLDITNQRWNEVFTELAGTRIFWSLGLPADRMYPMKKLVCFGCDSHPKEQKSVNMANTSIFNNVSLEKKMPGSKLGEGFEINDLISDSYSKWSEQTRIGFEVLALGARLIGFENAIALQNRLQCLPKELDKKTGICNVPVAIIQDTGSSFAASLSKMKKLEFGGNNPRGSLKYYPTETVFKTANTCVLYHSFGSDKGFANNRLIKVSSAGLEEMKKRLKDFTPEYVREIFTIARFGDMEPKLRDDVIGETTEAKRTAIIDKWTAAFMSRVEEIRNTNCQ